MISAAAPAIAIGLMLPVWARAADDKRANESHAAAKTYTVAYNVADLPVWQTDLKKAPEFAPEVLTAYLRSMVDPPSWNEGAEIRPFQMNASLVITQTKGNHEKIADLLETFRKAYPGEVTERVGAGWADEVENHSANRAFRVNDVIAVTATRDEMGESHFFDDQIEGASFRIAAVIVDVQANGNLKIEARRETKRGGKAMRKSLTGIVRPATIDPAGWTVPMNEISELRLETRTTGGNSHSLTLRSLWQVCTLEL